MSRERDRGEGAPGTRQKRVENDNEPQMLFLEDTIQIEVEDQPHPVIGVVARTMHDLDLEEGVWEDIDAAVCGKVATEDDLGVLQSTGQPPRHFLLFMPSSPENPPMLVHESECKLLDRALGFGDVVKRSLTSEMSGTVISVDTAVGVRHAYFDPVHPELWPSEDAIPDVPESELKLANEWNEGDFVIYKNCWMGVVDDVMEEVAVKLQDDSVVFVEDPHSLEIPVYNPQEESRASEEDRDVEFIVDNTNGGVAVSHRPISMQNGRPETVVPPSHLSPGQTVTTTKANLRRGRWVYGSYNASITPIGIVVEVRPIRLYVSWLCQNMMVPGKFVPVPRPDEWVEMEEEGSNIRLFQKSSGGYKPTNEEAFLNAEGYAGGGMLQVGDRVRFRDLDAAVETYQGKLHKIKRREQLGFDVNVMIVTETRTKVRVLWQDLTETVEHARDLAPYSNVDDHEVWPGEIVLVKSEISTEAMASERERIVRGMWDAFKVAAPTDATPPSEDVEFLRPAKVGVVQSVDPAARVAQVRWYLSPKLEVAGGLVIPGSMTGELADASEEVSFYEVVAHQALGCRRGDFVLIAPERASEDSSSGNPSISASSTSSTPQTPANNADGNAGQVVQMVENLRGMVDGGLLANLSAALGNHSHPQLQAVSRLLNQFPGLLQVTHPSPSPTTSDHSFIRQPPRWIGEVVDLGLDGLLTIRLGALDSPEDIRVPIERLHIIFNEDMDLGDSDDEDEDDSLAATSGTEEQVEYIYDGGERLDDGQEGDWATDDEEMTDVVDNPPSNNKVPNDTNGAPDEPVPVTPLIPDDTPAPSAIPLPEGSPVRFQVLDSPIPSDHAFLSQPSAPATPTFTRRIVREHKILASSLPEGIFVRTWDSRLDLLRVLIVGPLNTPYELAPFVFDFFFPTDFPTSPPQGHFHSWTNGIGRVNPNLYEDGRICLSLLGTWHAENRGEGWNPNGSSVLQLLVSLMGLVLVREPYYNEAGFNVYQGSTEAALNSRLYSEKAFILSRGFVRHALQQQVQGMEDIVQWLYRKSNGPGLLKMVVERVRGVVARSQEETKTTASSQGGEVVSAVSRGALVMLRRVLTVLEEIFRAGETS